MPFCEITQHLCDKIEGSIHISVVFNILWGIPRLLFPKRFCYLSQTLSPSIFTTANFQCIAFSYYRCRWDWFTYCASFGITRGGVLPILDSRYIKYTQKIIFLFLLFEKGARYYCYPKCNEHFTSRTVLESR